MRSGPICVVFGKRKTGRLFIKRLEVWVHTRNGWRSKNINSIPKKDQPRIKKRLKERKVWPWPKEGHQLHLVKQAKLRAATGYTNWSMGPLPTIEMDDNTDTETDEDNDDECNEDDEV